MGSIKIEPAVTEILAASRLDGSVLFLPDRQLERKLYEKVNKCLVMLGGKWNRNKKGHVFEEDPTERLDDLLLTGQITDEKADCINPTIKSCV
jgi:hypothetical protein